MFFKIILLLTFLGLQNIYASGNARKNSVESTVERPKLYDILGIESSINLKSRHKRENIDGEQSVNGKSRVQDIQDYLRTIEQYMPTIKEKIGVIQRKFSGYSDFNRDMDIHANNPDEHFDSNFSGRKPDIDIPWKYSERDFYPPRMNENNDDSDRIINYEGGGVNRTVFSSYNQTPKPVMEWPDENDERIGTTGDFETQENSDIPPNFKPNYMPPRDFESAHDFYDDDVRAVKQYGSNNFFSECGRSVHGHDWIRPMKPMVINIRSNCLCHPQDRFGSRYNIPSRTLYRPFQFSPSKFQHRRYCSHNFRDMPDYYFN